MGIGDRATLEPGQEKEQPYLPVIFEDVRGGGEVWNDLLTVWAPCREGERVLHMRGRLQSQSPSQDPQKGLSERVSH